MIATHNIKVNDRWYKAGEEYGVEEPRQVELPIEPEVKEEVPVEEELKQVQKPRTSASRRKTTNK